MIGERFPRSWDGWESVSRKAYLEIIFQLEFNEVAVIPQLDDLNTSHGSEDWFDSVKEHYDDR